MPRFAIEAFHGRPEFVERLASSARSSDEPTQTSHAMGRMPLPLISGHATQSYITPRGVSAGRRKENLRSVCAGSQWMPQARRYSAYGGSRERSTMTRTNERRFPLWA